MSNTITSRIATLSALVAARPDDAGTVAALFAALQEHSIARECANPGAGEYHKGYQTAVRDADHDELADAADARQGAKHAKAALRRTHDASATLRCADESLVMGVELRTVRRAAGKALATLDRAIQIAAPTLRTLDDADGIGADAGADTGAGAGADTGAGAGADTGA